MQVKKSELWCGCWPEIKFKNDEAYLRHMKHYHKDWYYSGNLGRSLLLEGNK